MPDISQYVRRAPFEKATAPQVGQDWFTDETRALAQSGQAIADIGGLLEQIQRQDEARRSMEFKADAELGWSVIANNYNDNDWAAGKFGESDSKVIRKPLPTMASEQMKEYGATLPGLQKKYLEGMSKNSRARVDAWVTQSKAQLSRGANARQSQFHESRMKLSFFRASVAGQDRVARGADPEAELAQLTAYAATMPEGIKLQIEGQIETIKGKFARVAEERQEALRRGQIDLLADQAWLAEQQQAGKGGTFISNLKNLERQERTELEARLNTRIANKNERDLEEQLEYQDTLRDREEQGEELVYTDFDNPLHSKQPKVRDAAWDAYRRRETARKKGDPLEGDPPTFARLFGQTQKVWTSQQPKSAVYEQLNEARNSNKITTDEYKELAKNIERKWTQGQAKSMNRAYAEARNQLLGIEAASLDWENDPTGSVKIMQELFGKKGETKKQIDLRFAHLATFGRTFTDWYAPRIDTVNEKELYQQGYTLYMQQKAELEKELGITPKAAESPKPVSPKNDPDDIRKWLLK